MWVTRPFASAHCPLPRGRVAAMAISVPKVKIALDNRKNTMSTGNLTPEEKNERMNILSVGGYLPDGIVVAYSEANALMQQTVKEQLQDKYLHLWALYQKDMGIKDTDKPVAEVSAPAEQPQQPKRKKRAKKVSTRTPEEQYEHTKASNMYKKLARVFSYQLLREEVLVDQNHRCYCCDREFPVRSAFKPSEEHPQYPLMVRCIFPIVKYIEAHKLYEMKALLADQKVYNKENYVAICSDCKPMSFKGSD